MTAVHAVVRSEGRVALVVERDSERLRRELGLTAWLALQSLVLDATLVDEQLVVATSARHLGRLLEIGKDRAAAALTALRDAGLLTRVATREGTTARFVAARYTINVAVSSPGDAFSSGDAVASVAQATRTIATRRVERELSGQLFVCES
jgi:hypothetical protein